MLHVEDIPENVDSIRLEHTEHCNAPFDQGCVRVFHSNHPPRMYLDQGIIVGHPRGDRKCMAIVRLEPGQPNDLERRYSLQANMPGSSGSPVLVNARSDALYLEVFMLCIIFQMQVLMFEMSLTPFLTRHNLSYNRVDNICKFLLIEEIILKQ